MKCDIKNIVDNFVNEMFRGTNENLLKEDDTLPIKMAKRKLGNAMQKYYDKDVENRTNMHRWAKNIGVNLDKGDASKAYSKSLGIDLDNPNSVQNGSYEKAVGNISNELKDALKDMQRLKNPSISPEEREAITSKWGGFGGLQRYRDIADKLSLTAAYDQERAKEAGTENAFYGTNYKAVDANGNEYLSSKKPKDNVVGYDFENLDLTNVPDSEIWSYFKSGTRQNHHFGEDENNPTYGELAEMAKNGNQEALSDLKNLYFKAMFNKILNSKFGYDFKIPTSMYTFGNSKLPDDTLVINFTTAHRCPAWNECLVGYACYARGSEHNYEGLHKKNSNLHLMWQTAHKDPELLDAMFNVIRMHLINPSVMASTLLDNPKTSQKWFKILSDKSQDFMPLTNRTFKSMPNDKNQLLSEPKWDKNNKNNGEEFEENKTILGMALQEVLGGAEKPLKRPTGARDNLAGLIFNKKFSELFTKEELKIIKSNPKVFRAKFIRLNEEGDFIGQWLLDAFDEFAGELKLLGISTAAYTCRNLNFTAIKNIIINASTTNVGTSGEEEGNVSNAIARRFFAVSTELYNSLEDTYVPNGRKFNYVPPTEGLNKKDYDGSKPIIPLHKFGKEYHVKYALKPYTNNGITPETYNDRFDANGPTTKNRLYYKCPCGRHGDVIGDNGKPIKMDCYLCRMCYEPKNQKTGEIYVLVEVHGDNTDSFDMNRANQKRGISNQMATYREARNIFSNRLCEEHAQAEKLGMQMVANNIITSAKDRISSIADSEAASLQAESKKFSDLLKSINEIDKKKLNKIID